MQWPKHPSPRLAAGLLAAFPCAASAHDGDMSLLVVGPMSLAASILFIRVVRTRRAVRLLAMIFVWPLLFFAVFGAVQATEPTDQFDRVLDSDQAFKRLMLFCSVFVPVGMVLVVYAFERIRRWFGSGAD